MLSSRMLTGFVDLALEIAMSCSEDHILQNLPHLLALTFFPSPLQCFLNFVGIGIHVLFRDNHSIVT